MNKSKRYIDAKMLQISVSHAMQGVVGVKDLNLTKIAKEELNEINAGDFLSKE